MARKTPPSQWDAAASPVDGVVRLPVEDLPTLPVAAAQALRVANDRSAGPTDLTRVLRRDPTLTARVLQVANSPYFGFRCEISTVERALGMLGMRRARGIISTMALAPVFVGDVPGLISAKGIWQHSLASALWAEHVAAVANLADAEMLYTAALMHDLGILALLRCRPEIYQAVLQRAKDSGESVLAVEREVMQRTHAWVGAMLCAKWGLPPGLTELVSAHHSDRPATREIAVLMLGEAIAKMVGYTAFEWAEPEPVRPELIEAVGLDGDALEKVLGHGAEIQEQLESYASAAPIGRGSRSRTRL